MTKQRRNFQSLLSRDGHATFLRLKNGNPL